MNIYHIKCMWHVASIVTTFHKLKYLWLITNSNIGMVLQRDTLKFSYNIILMILLMKNMSINIFMKNMVNKYLSKKSNIGKF